MARFVLNDDGLTNAQLRWRERSKRLMAAQPKSFKSAMNLVHRADRLQLDRMVYSTAGKGRRSGNLRKAEKLEFPSSEEAVITNDAATEWGGKRRFYAWWVAEGSKARTKARGVYAWMVDPRAPRPQNSVAWAIARRMGLAVFARKVRGVQARPWRKAAIRAAQHFIPLAARGATKEAMSE